MRRLGKERPSAPRRRTARFELVLTRSLSMAIHELFPYLCVRDTSEAIAFYRRAFGAEEKLRLTEPSGRIGHAEIEIGGRVVMMSDEFPEFGVRAPGPAEKCTMILN